MSVVPIERLTVWRGSDFTDPGDFTHRLTDAELAEIDAAVGAVAEQKIDPIAIGKHNFVLPQLGKFLMQNPRRPSARSRLHGPWGPAGRALFDRADGGGISRHRRLFRQARSQNGKGHILGHVKDLGRSIDDPSARIYQTTHRQTFHTDSVDIVALLCLKAAKAGGLSRIVSSMLLYAEMVRRRPDLAVVLFEPFCFDRRGEVPPGKKGYYETPIFHWYADNLTVMYGNRYYIESAQRFPEVPRLTAKQIEALDLFDALANDPTNYLDIAFKPGDIQLIHNHVILHDRTDYEDWPERERKRHLLRLWLCPPNGRPLPPVFADRYGGTVIGDRGGIVLRGATMTAPLEAC